MEVGYVCIYYVRGFYALYDFNRIAMCNFYTLYTSVIIKYLTVTCCKVFLNDNDLRYNHLNQLIFEQKFVRVVYVMFITFLCEESQF